MVPTGIPPYVHLYQQPRETQQVIDRMPDVLLSDFSRLLDENGVGAGAMRKEELQATILELLNEAEYNVNRRPNQDTARSFTGGEMVSFIGYQKISNFQTLMLLVSDTYGGLEM
ncbi:hypothetical protein PHMEG_00015577 [Phytophthora megakarya]|uniref:Uncharacterized protein n=1 Tax=Phytophthora megakarya TaxID=4795 RepID=A0A225W1E3_9STRA|nr:hypothetical protein PHMEG_00015577 [Phytophthora megakarya]